MISITANGRLTSDPELKQTKGGTQYIQFTIASNDGRRGSDGNYETSFLNCTTFSPHSINYLTKYGKQGMRIVATGSLTINRVDNNGQSVSYAQANISSVEVIDTKAESEGNNQGQSQQPTRQAPTQKKDDYYANDNNVDDSSLPF